MRLLLDTVTLSAIRRPDREPAAFRAFLQSVDLDTAYIAAVSVAEIGFGIERVRRRDPAFSGILAGWRDRLLAEFDGRILVFDRDDALRCASLPTPEGRLTSDSMIAATALSNGLAVATRNVRDFEPLSVLVVNPWEGPSAAWP